MSNKSSSEELIEALRKSPGDGGIANELLRQMFRGYPVENLRQLLNDERDTVVEVGVWIASELAEKAAPVVSEVQALLKHHNERIRYLAINTILTTPPKKDDLAIVEIINLTDDPSEIVRQNGIRFLSGVQVERLRAVLESSDKLNLSSIQLNGINLVVEFREQYDLDKLMRVIKDSDRALLKYGLAAIGGVYSEVSEVIKFALRHGDQDSKVFASNLVCRTDLEDKALPAVKKHWRQIKES